MIRAVSVRLFALLVWSVLFILAHPAFSRADCGHIPVYPEGEPSPDPVQPDDTPPDVAPPDTVQPGDDSAEWKDWQPVNPVAYRMTIQEPSQKAVLAWNQKEQIMVLSTELKSSRKGKLLEIMPLPSRPKLSKGDADLFDKTLKLFRSKHNLPEPVVARIAKSKPAGEVIEVVQIGYHKLSVARVLNPKEFVQWADNYARGQLGPKTQAVITPVGRQVIGQYLREGYKYWVFDLIEVDTKPQPHVAVQYRFQTDFLYYPLRITRTSGSGGTKVELLVLTDQLLSHFRGLDPKSINMPQTSVDVSLNEVQNLNTEIANLFGPQPVKLRYWEIQGPIQSFTGDLQAATQPVRRIRFN